MPYAGQVRAALTGDYKKIDTKSNQSREILEYMLRNTKFNSSQMSQDLNIEHDVLSTYIKALASQGLVNKTNKTNKTKTRA
jgi:predicted transcriptional regulator